MRAAFLYEPGFPTYVTDPYERETFNEDAGGIFGPLFAGGFFEANPAIPYMTCAIIALLTGVVAWSRLAQKSAEGSR